MLDPFSVFVCRSSKSVLTRSYTKKDTKTLSCVRGFLCTSKKDACVCCTDSFKGIAHIGTPPDGTAKGIARNGVGEFAQRLGSSVVPLNLDMFEWMIKSKWMCVLCACFA